MGTGWRSCCDNVRTTGRSPDKGFLEGSQEIAHSECLQQCAPDGLGLLQVHHRPIVAADQVLYPLYRNTQFVGQLLQCDAIRLKQLDSLP